MCKKESTKLYVTVKYEKVREGVKLVMGGKVLDYEAKRIKNEGKLEMLFDLVRENILSLKEAAVQAKLTEEAFQEKMRGIMGEYQSQCSQRG